MPEYRIDDDLGVFVEYEDGHVEVTYADDWLDRYDLFAEVEPWLAKRVRFREFLRDRGDENPI